MRPLNFKEEQERTKMINDTLLTENFARKLPISIGR